MSPAANRGLTLVEVLVSMGMIAVLLVSVGLCYRHGMAAWAKVRSRTSMLGQLQVASGKMTKELENSVVESLEVAPLTFSFLSEMDDQSKLTEIDGMGFVVWQQYTGFTYDSASRQLMRFGVPLALTAGPRTMPEPLTSFDPTFQAVDTIPTAKILVRNLAESQFIRSGNRVTWRAKTDEDIYGRDSKEILEFSWSGSPQNQIGAP